MTSQIKHKRVLKLERNIIGIVRSALKKVYERGVKIHPTGFIFVKHIDGKAKLSFSPRIIRLIYLANPAYVRSTIDFMGKRFGAEFVKMSSRTIRPPNKPALCIVTVNVGGYIDMFEKYGGKKTLITLDGKKYWYTLSGNELASDIKGALLHELGHQIFNENELAVDDWVMKMADLFPRNAAYIKETILRHKKRIIKGVERMKKFYPHQSQRTQLSRQKIASLEESHIKQLSYQR